jgi:hypothetical protein
MALYQQDPQSAIAWPEPMETVYQSLGSGSALPGRYKRPDVSLSDRFFMAAVANLPRDQRPWGSLTWLSDIFGVSRPTVYRIAAQLRTQALAEPRQPRPTPASADVPAPSVGAPTPISVTRERIQRTLLTMALPGNMALRPMQATLQAAFGQTRSVGYISELLSAAGRQAGRLLTTLDYRPLGRVIALRDETFFHDWPILLVVEPRTSVILLGHVAQDRSAETWGAALLVAQDSGVQLGGLVEDMGRTFPKSLEVAALPLPVQKDPWHVTHWAGRVRRDLERTAYRALEGVYRLEKQLAQHWDTACFANAYIPAVAQAEALIAQHDTFSQWRQHLRDALEVVDWRSGEIRDQALNGWLLDETLQALQALDHPSVRTFVRTLRRFRPQLLTYLAWLAELLGPWRQRLAQVLPEAGPQTDAERAMARAWRLRQGVINGQHWQRQVREADAWLDLLVADTPALRPLADALGAILDACGHASSLIETVNGLLKAGLLARQTLHDRDTAQAYLNLFVLWHNMRVFQRGKRAGKSPFQWAGIQTASADWLDLLGYPAA